MWVNKFVAMSDDDVWYAGSLKRLEWKLTRGRDDTLLFLVVLCNLWVDIFRVFWVQRSEWVILVIEFDLNLSFYDSSVVRCEIFTENSTSNIIYLISNLNSANALNWYSAEYLNSNKIRKQSWFWFRNRLKILLLSFFTQNWPGTDSERQKLP